MRGASHRHSGGSEYVGGQAISHLSGIVKTVGKGHLVKAVELLRTTKAREVDTERQLERAIVIWEPQRRVSLVPHGDLVPGRAGVGQRD